MDEFCQPDGLFVTNGSVLPELKLSVAGVGHGGPHVNSLIPFWSDVPDGNDFAPDVRAKDKRRQARTRFSFRVREHFAKTGCPR